MKKFAIACNARAGFKLGVNTLILVDRKITKKYWWTSDNPHIILEYESHYAAEYACKRLKKNSPRIIDAEEAKDILRIQSNAIIEYEREKDREAGMEAVEAGWDGHKNWRCD